MSSVRLSLFIGQTSLIASEDPQCRLVFTNEGEQPVDVPNLNVNVNAPEFTLEDLNRPADTRVFDPQMMERATGARALAMNPGDGPWLTLAPGKQSAADFPLSHRIPLPLPGDYGISASFRTQGRVVRSNTAKVEIAPAQTAHSCLAHSHGGPSLFWYESWVARGTASLLFVRAARVGARFQQLQCLRVASLPTPVRTVISVAPNGRGSGDRSIAWLYGGAFHIVDVGLERITRGIRSAPLPSGGGSIVPYLWKDPDTDETRALVWEEIDRIASRLTLVSANSEGLSAIWTMQLPLPQPTWIRTFHDSQGGRLALLLVEDGVGARLSGIDCAGALAPGQDLFQSWPWRVRAVSAQMTRDDTIVGVIVGQPLSQGLNAPSLICCWSIDRTGKYSAGVPRPWPTLDVGALGEVQMVVDVAGQPAVLGHSPQRGWTCVRDDVSYKVDPPPGLVVDSPPSLALSPDGVTPMVVWRDAWRGLVPQPVGVEVPDFSGVDFIQPPLVPEDS